MSEEDWQQSRLIPTSGISGAEEAERRATSALLAVMSAVKEFGQAITKPFGAPTTWLSTYVETPFKLDGKSYRPDGLIRASRGGKDWTCLVEVKTGNSELEVKQVEAYLDIARENKYDCVLTISNQIPAHPGDHPLTVDKRKTKSVQLFHLSWSEIVTQAVITRVHRGVADPDQAWILGELIRYLKHPKSGAATFTDMGEQWTSVRDAAEFGTLRVSDSGLVEVLDNWERTLSALCMAFAQELGVDVSVVYSKKERDDVKVRRDTAKRSLVDNASLTGQIRVGGAVSDISIEADLRAARLALSVELGAPKEGRPATRVNWLVRQLKDADGSLVLSSWAAGSRSSLSEKLEAVREKPEILVDDPKKELGKFRVTEVTTLGMGRRSGKNAFVDDVIGSTWKFYSEVVQTLSAWTPKAPQAPSGGRTATEAAGIDTRYSEDEYRATTPPVRESQVGRQVYEYGGGLHQFPWGPTVHQKDEGGRSA